MVNWYQNDGKAVNTLSNVLKISDAASLGLHAMGLLATRPDTGFSTKQIARDLQVSEAHLSKVLQRLTKVGLAASTRGPRGGFALARSAESITLLDVYEAIEGPLVATRCLLGKRVCNGRQCILGDLLTTVDGQVRDYLATTRLADLTSIYQSQPERSEKADDDTQEHSQDR